MLLPAAASAADIVAGLRLTGWFLEKHVFTGQGGRMPPARERLIDRLKAGRGAWNGLERVRL